MTQKKEESEKMDLNIPTEALDAAARVYYENMPKPKEWSENYDDLPLMIKHDLREMMLDLMTPAYAVLRTAWENENNLQVPDDLSGLDLGNGEV